MTSASPSRRQALALAAGLGLSLRFAAAPAAARDAAERKLVVVLCRGGMDGLAVAPPLDDPDYTGLRGQLMIPRQDLLPIGDGFAVHPALKSVAGLAGAGQVRLAPAVATQDRGRSHFAAQDVLETALPAGNGAGGGWLNRALGVLGGAGRPADALAVGGALPLILRGQVQAGSWTPGRSVDAEGRLPTLLQDLYRDDPVLGPAFARGLETESLAQAVMTRISAPTPAERLPTGSADTGGMEPAATAVTGASSVDSLIRRGQDAARILGSTTGGLMREPAGPQIVVLSIDGFDTHANQGRESGQLATRLGYLDAVLDGMHAGLGETWGRTVVLVVTEFGRTARVNGTRGTDHGTASAALVLGGALKPGGIVGDWPGLAPADLYENRDLRPTLDMRSLFKGVLADHLGVDRKALETVVFPSGVEARPMANLV